MLDREQAQHIRRLLWTWGRVDKQCAELLNDLRSLSNMIDDARDTLRSSASDGQPRSSMPGDPTASAIISIESIVQAFEKSAGEAQMEIDRLQALRRAIDALMMKLAPLEREIIRMKYKLGYTAVYIGIKLECSERKVYYHEETAIEKISQGLQFFAVD